MYPPYDWTDVAKLNFSNPELRIAMIGDMKFWLTEVNVDGFRCDEAGDVPTNFWETANKELRKVKPIFMLAEAEKYELLENAFEMQYGWEGHHIMNEMAKGKKTVKDWDAYMQKIDTLLQEDDFNMNFTSNHDENSWNGTVQERMGAAAEAFAAMSYTIPGMPLIYNGQEFDLDKRLAFFEKDTITHTKGKFYSFYEKMNNLKAQTDALDGGKKAAKYSRITTSADEQVLAFDRTKNGDTLVFIANLSPNKITAKMEYFGEFTNYMDQQKVDLSETTSMDLTPWEYKILLKK
jgi:glycosidase